MKILSSIQILPLILLVVAVSAVPAFASGGTINVPEPVSMTLLGIGLAGLAGKKVMDRRRR